MFAGATLALTLPATAKESQVTISSAATRNMQCGSGVCAPTAANAVLNARDLETMLASGSVEVTTTGSGVQADNIAVRAPLAWKSSATLTFDAYDGIAIAAGVTVKRSGGLTLTTGDGGSSGTLAITKKGHVTFKKLASRLVIDGAAYTLVGNIATLASDITANPAGDYALAKDYDAAGDGTYSGSPVSTTFTGTFEGLGNRISNLAIDDTSGEQYLGMFAKTSGALRDLGLPNASINATVGAQWVTAGALVGWATGAIVNVHATGAVELSGGGPFYGGGLAGASYGMIENSYAAVEVSSTATDDTNQLYVGGLAGTGNGAENSYATGSVSGSTEEGSPFAGGLFGVLYEYGSVSNCYATGSVFSSGTYEVVAGGLLGDDGYKNQITSSYSTGTVSVSGGSYPYAGGLVGIAGGDSTYANDYWDTTTSGTETGVGSGSSSGISALTTADLQSGLPEGFLPTIWREKSKTEGGLPFLIANPPAR
jgi:hypothetical protein